MLCSWLTTHWEGGQGNPLLFSVGTCWYNYYEIMQIQDRYKTGNVIQNKPKTTSFQYWITFHPLDRVSMEDNTMSLRCSCGWNDHTSCPWINSGIIATTESISYIELPFLCFYCCCPDTLNLSVYTVSLNCQSSRRKNWRALRRYRLMKISQNRKFRQA